MTLARVKLNSMVELQLTKVNNLMADIDAEDKKATDLVLAVDNTTEEWKADCAKMCQENTQVKAGAVSQVSEAKTTLERIKAQVSRASDEDGLAQLKTQTGDATKRLRLDHVKKFRTTIKMSMQIAEQSKRKAVLGANVGGSSDEMPTRFKLMVEVQCSPFVQGLLG